MIRSPMRMHEKIILRVTAKFFIPLILLFALYVQFHGDFGPGGGFQAGVIFAAAYVLYGLIFGLDAAKKVLPPAVAEAGSALGFLLYASVGVLLASPTQDIIVPERLLAAQTIWERVTRETAKGT